MEDYYFLPMRLRSGTITGASAPFVRDYSHGLVIHDVKREQGYLDWKEGHSNHLNTCEICKHIWFSAFISRFCCYNCSQVAVYRKICNIHN